jgi:hypothetical protein
MSAGLVRAILIVSGLAALAALALSAGLGSGPDALIAVGAVFAAATLVTFVRVARFVLAPERTRR